MLAMSVNAWAAQRGLLLGQVRTEEKSNEITAIAGETRKAEADYVLSLKANHPTLHDDAS
jgi:predicted transposase YbfD/YdcC